MLSLGSQWFETLYIGSLVLTKLPAEHRRAALQSGGWTHVSVALVWLTPPVYPQAAAGTVGRAQITRPAHSHGGPRHVSATEVTWMQGN